MQRTTSRVSPGLRHATQLLAFSKILNHGVLVPREASGHHDPVTPWIVRSGCGMRIVTRPSSLQTDVSPDGEPFGFAG